MDVQVESIDYCKVQIKYTGDAEDVRKNRHSVAKEMSKTYPVKGFRTGKASPEVIKLTYKNEVEGYLKQQMIERAYQDSIAEKGIKPFGGPQIISTSLDGNDFKAEFSVHTIPEFELKQYKGFEIPKLTTEMNVDELTQKILQELRIQHADLVPYGENEFVQDGDGIVVQYNSLIGEEELTDLSSEGATLEVGKINVPGFGDALIGMKPGEEREFTLHTPEDFSEKYGDKDLTFKVKLITGSKKVPMALDDDLAKKVNLVDYAALETEARNAASTRIQGIENARYQDQIGRRLVAEHDFVVPAWILEPEAKVQAQMAKKEWEKLTEEEQKEMLKGAEEGIKLSLVLEKVREEEPEAVLTDEELFELAQKNIAQYTNNPQAAMQDIAQKGQIGMLLSRVKDEYTLNFIIKQSTIVE